MGVPPSSSNFKVSGAGQEPDVHSPEIGAASASTSAPTKNTIPIPENVKKAKSSWDKALSKLEGTLRDLVREMKTAKGPEKEKLEKSIKELEESIDHLQKGIQELGVPVVPGQQGMQQLTADEAKGAIQAGSALSGTAAAEASKAIALIKTMVDGIQVGKIGETTFTSVDLKQKAAAIPSFFEGANLTITQTEGSKITISFSNMTPTQEKMAYAAITNPDNQRELQGLFQNLADRGITVTGLQIGQQPPIQPAAVSPEGGQRERGDREGGGGGREGGDKEGEKREKRER